jgi:hypothetical protein
MTNTSKERFEYWISGSGNYPPIFVKAKVTDAAGKTEELPIFNGQSFASISGVAKSLGTGDSIVIPAAIAPLPKGNYLIEVNGGSAKVTIKDDDALLKKREEDLLDRIGKGEPFATQVVATYLTPSLRELCLQELSAADVDTACNIAFTLTYIQKLPDASLPLLAKAIEKHLTQLSQKQKRSGELWDLLANLTGRIGSDDALEVLVKLSHNDTVRAAGSGITALGTFKQDRAIKELQGFLTNKNDGLRYLAAMTLANRQDSTCLEVLLELAGDRKSSWRGAGCMALICFPNDPRVEPAIRSCLDDRMSGGQAKEALRLLHEVQKKGEQKK